jgi:hypothetical protein
MAFKTFFSQKVCTQITVCDVGMLSETLDGGSIGHKDSYIVQKRGFSDKAAVDR